MLIGVVGDVHWSETSSILRSQGERYTTRLHGLIRSVSWAEKCLEEAGCSSITYLGDFFDKPVITSMETQALMDVYWANLPHDFIVGNHEVSGSNMQHSVAYLLERVCPQAAVYKKFEPICTHNGRTFWVLPYLRLESEVSLQDVAHGVHMEDVVFSHNDLHIQYGGYKFTSGLNVTTIEQGCSLFLNGHLHNGGKVGSNVYNIGNLTGQNFSEDAKQYRHNVAVLDTDTLQLQLIENPYAFNFYKCSWTGPERFSENDVVSMTCREEDSESARNCLRDACAYKIVTLHEKAEGEAVRSVEPAHVDHIQRFRQQAIESFGNGSLLLSEVDKVCGGSV